MFGRDIIDSYRVIQYVNPWWCIKDCMSICLKAHCMVCTIVSYVMEFLAWWVLKSKVFNQKSTVVKWNCCILWIDIAWDLQKLGLILESKVVQKLSLPKLIFLDEIFFWKNSVDFRHRKLTLKVQFWHFLRPWHYVNLQNTAISFEYCWFLRNNIAF